MAKTHVIDGVTYVEVERRAQVGDYVLITEFDGYKVKAIRKVDRLSGISDDFYVDEPVGRNDEDYLDCDDDRYVTLEPLESEEVTVDQSQASEQVEVDERDASPSVVEMLANLARRVTSLERQLADTQRNVERQAEELENAKHRISKHATMFGAVEEKVEMLAERTNYRALAKEMARRLSR